MSQFISRAADYMPADATPAAKLAAMERRDTLAKNKRLAAKMPVRYLVRDDGQVYGWNERLASNPRFRVVGELPTEYIEAEAARKEQKAKQKEHMIAHREAAQKRLAEERKARAQKMLEAKDRVPDSEKAAEAQAESEEAFIKSAGRDALREFALTNYNVRLPIGEVDLTRVAVINLWMGEDFEVGEPADWNDRNTLVAFAKDKLFRKMFKGIALEKAQMQVREWLDSYNKPSEI